MDRRRLAADRAREAKSATFANDRLDRIEDGGIALVVGGAKQLAVAVDSEHKLGEVVRADRDTGDPEGRVRRQPIDDRRHLGHDPSLETGVDTERTGVQKSQTCLELM